MMPAPERAPALVRRSGPRLLPAWHWHTLAQLRDAIGWRDTARECIVADLALGGWRGHAAAREWAAQLDIAAPALVQPELGPDAAHAEPYADTVGRLIDNESRGDVNFAAALDFAVRLLAALRDGPVRHVLLVAPLPGRRWGGENLQLVRLLCDAAPAHGFTFGLLLRGDAPAPDLPGFVIDLRTTAAPVQAATAPWCRVPGLLDAAWLPPARDAALETLPLADGRTLVAPNSRPLELGAAAPPADLPAWLRAAFELERPVPDAAFLQREAGLRFAEGAYDLAYALLDGIHADLLPPLDAALVAAQRQHIAIALMDFEAAAQGPLPAADLPDAVRAALYQGKAWGLVMTGDAAAAELPFARARALLDPRRQQRLYLYLLNISALNKLRLGETVQALAFEKDIEGQLQALDPPDWHLVYINCLNQARIFKKTGDLVHAETYYARAFFVTHQLRNESDLLYTNLCLAQLAELQGRHELAFVHWLRATLHWLSNPLPEALAPRVAQALLGRPLSNRGADPEAIAAVLDRQLRAAAGRHGLACMPLARAIPLHRVGPGARPARCIGQSGWSVLLADVDHGPMPFDGPATAALQRLAGGVLATLVPGADVGAARAILTDDRHGIELPASPREVLWSSLAWRVPALCFDGRDYRLPDAGDRAHLAACYVAERSRAIAAIDTDGPAWRVHFKRYLAPYALEPLEQACLRRLAQPQTLAQLGATLDLAPAACLALVERMRARRLLDVA